MASLFEDRKQSGGLTASWNGSGAEPANTAVTISEPASSVVYAQLDGTFSATITFEVSVNETTFVAIPATKIDTGARATTATTTGIYAIPAAGRKVRARCSSFVSGPVAIVLSATNGTPDFVALVSAAGGGGSAVDTELPAAAVLNDTFNPGSTAVPQIGAIVEGVTQGGAGEVSQVRAHTGSSDARVTSINGLVVQSYGMLFNGTTWDRWRGTTTSPGFARVSPGVTSGFGDGVTFGSFLLSHDETGTGRPVASIVPVFNGSTWDRLRAANSAAATTGTGLLGAGPLVFDGTNWQKLLQVPAADAQAATGIAATHSLLFNGTTYDRARGTPAFRAQVAGAQGVNPADAYSGSFNYALGTDDNTRPAYSGIALYNGASWDRARTSMDVTLLTSASRTTTQTSADIISYNNGAIQVVLDVTSAGTGSITFSIDGKDVISGKYYNLLTGVAVTGNSTNVYTVDPSIPAVANVTAQKRVPRTFRIVITANNANAMTYSVGYCLMPAGS